MGNGRPCPLAPGGESPKGRDATARRSGHRSRAARFFVPACPRPAHCSPRACMPTVSSPVVVVDAKAMDGGRKEKGVCAHARKHVKSVLLRTPG